MPYLHLFNPSHEMALAANSNTYTPPKNIQAMERDLCRMPLLWADPNDYILTPDGITDTQGNPTSMPGDTIPLPWGWNQAVRQRFLHLGIDAGLMPSAEEISRWREFASRKWAVDYARRFYELIQESNAEAMALVENHMEFCKTQTDIQAWISNHQGNTVILKSEYSSSGRGNHIVDSLAMTEQESGKAGNSLRLTNQCADLFYDKLMDFAMEFEVTPDKVTYLGLSVFEASREGKYSFNHLRPQSELRSMIESSLDAEASAPLAELAELHTDLLSRQLVGSYRGIVGIDMMVVEGGRIHPCVEINLRNNMGVVAMYLEKHKTDSGQASRCGGSLFQPVIEDNKFYIGIKH